MAGGNRILLSRRGLLKTAGASTLVSTVGAIAPSYISRAADRPLITHGIQSGDVSVDSAMVWARADRPSRMHVEVSTTESFKTIRRSVFANALPDSDFTAKLLVQGLPPGQDIFYRIRFEDLSAPTISGEQMVGRFRTAPTDRRSISFVWSGDTAGQGWGIDESRGGMRGYATMLRNRPDFFIHNGDTIYADSPIQAEKTLPNGEIWRNIVTPEKAKVAETLDEFRGNYRYNLLDRNLLAFNREIPTFAQWDDHEVTNNWWPGEPLDRAEHKSKNYSVRNASILAARGHRAFHEYMPVRPSRAEPGRVYRKIAYGPLLDIFMLDMRSYRGPNAENMQAVYGPDAYLLGPAQSAWLKRELKNSRATWKVISADMSIGLINVYDGNRFEAAPNRDGGMPRGRELEIADLLSFIRRRKVRNILWITTDAHYTAAHRFDPNRAAFQDFDPFWEFMSGPIHAGTFGPGTLDKTFGPEAVFNKAPAAGRAGGLSPNEGLQFFGHVAIDGRSQVMTVTLKDIDDRALWSTRIEPKLS